MEKIRKHTISFKNAFTGIYWGIKNQPNFKVHFIAVGLVILLSYIYGVTKTESLIIVLTIGLVLTTELFNTSIEALSDKVAQNKYHELIKVTKDVGAGAVLAAAVTSVIIGLMIFVPKL